LPLKNVLLYLQNASFIIVLAIGGHQIK